MFFDVYKLHMLNYTNPYMGRGFGSLVVVIVTVRVSVVPVFKEDARRGRNKRKTSLS